MLVDHYPEFSTDLSDIFDAELFNPSDFTLDPAPLALGLPDYLDSFPIPDFPIPQLHFPSDPTTASSSSRSSLSSPSPFLIDNDNAVNHSMGIDPQLVDTPPSAVTDHPDEDDEDLPSLISPPTSKTQKPTITIPPTLSNNPSATQATTTTTAHKSRKGTVLSGGIVKKSAYHSSSIHTKEKENSALALVSSGVAAAKKTAATRHARNPSVSSNISPPSSSFGLPTIQEDPKSSVTSFSSAIALGKNSFSDDGDIDDQDLPQDWRPSPEVLAKMTSKEKRQLRNKISARNFRIRRKEYISTLEGDIAERDRLLDHFRTQLGTRESENLALRQEIAALKKALLEGRGLDASDDGVNVGINLPPPKMLPEQSAAEALMLAASAPAAPAPIPNLLTPNTQKDLPSSRVGSSSGFWGGVGMGAGGMGGITPVHTTLVPDPSVVLRRALMENINPSLNQSQPQLHGQQTRTPKSNVNLSGFDGFADANPFTLKTLDAYRMHLWGKMAAQQSNHQHNHLHSPSSSRTPSPSPPSSPYYYNAGSGGAFGGGLAERMRPHFFTSSSGLGLLGKHTGSSAYTTPPGSPVSAHKSIGPSHAQKEKEKENARQHQQALMAAMASQTILKKLGNAFWDAFVGMPSSASASAPSAVATSSNNNWDPDKVKRILEGKAVLRVVDVDTLPLPSSSASITSTSAVTMPTVSASEKCEWVMCDLLEESMRSLTIGKKA